MRKILLGTIASIFIFSAGTSEATKLYTVGSKMQSIINEACPSGTEKIRTVISSFSQLAAAADIDHSGDQQVSSFSSNLKAAANYLSNAISKTYGMGGNSGYNNLVKAINSVRQATWNVQRMQNKSWLSTPQSNIIENLSSVVDGMQDIITTKRPYIKSVSEKLNDLSEALTVFTNDLNAAAANATDTGVLVPEATPPQTNTSSNSDLQNQLLQQQLQQQQQQFQLLQQQIQQQQQLLNQYQQQGQQSTIQQPTLNNTLAATLPVQTPQPPTENNTLTASQPVQLPSVEQPTNAPTNLTASAPVNNNVRRRRSGRSKGR